MHRFIALIMFALLAWVTTGCGGPGEPVNRAAELRNLSKSSQGNASGGSNRDRSGLSIGGSPRSRPPRGGDQGKDESAGDESGQADDPNAVDPENAEGDKGEANAEKNPRRSGSSASSGFGSRRRPRGLSAGGGGRSGGGRADDTGQEEKEEQPVSAESNAATVDDDANMARRFTFFERANQAFATGNETEAFQYLYAHIIAEDNALEEHPISWYDGISEPRVGLRWGVAIDYKPRKFDGAPPKFGDAEPEATSRGKSSGGGLNLPGGRSGGRGGRSGGGRSGGGSGLTEPPATASPSSRSGATREFDDPNEQLVYYTGVFGDKFLQRIEMRRTHDESWWGKALHDIDVSKVFDVDGRRPGSNRGRRGNLGSRDNDPNRGGGGNLALDDGGAAAPAVPADTSPGNPPNRQNRDGRGNDAETSGFRPEFEAPPTSLEPGVIMLGMGDPTEMLEKAKTHGLDLLAVFDVMVSVSSRDVPKNSTLVSVYNVKTGEKVASTRRLNHLAYVKALADGRADQIETELDGIFQEATDNTFKASAIPEISAETAAKRVDFLANQDTSNPLPGLAEIRMYLDQNLISEDDFVAAAAELIGPENAALVVDADIQKREQSLRDWLPGQFEIEDNEDTTEFR